MAKTTQNVYGKYKEYGDHIKELQSSLMFMRIFSSQGVVFVLALFSTMFTAAAEQSDENYAFYLVSYPASDQATIANAQQQLQEYFGNRLEGYVDPHQYLVYATAAELRTLQENNLIISFLHYLPTASESLLGDTTGTEDVLISVFANADEQQIAATIREQGIVVTSVFDAMIQATIPLDTLQKILTIEGVNHVEEVPEYKLFNDKSVIVTGVTDVRSRFQLYGANQIIGVLDGGLDTGKIDASMHDDIEGRVIGISDAWGGPVGMSDNGVDYDSHGTHVTGSVLGNGVLSGSNPGQKQFANSYAGVAPEAKVDFYYAGGTQGTSFIPGLNLPSLIYTPSYQKGSRVNTNSWGIPFADGKYLKDAKDIDDYMWQNKEYLVIFAAGNNPGSGTVSPPCTNKNGICVSGIERDNVNSPIYAQGPTLDGRFGVSIRAPAAASLGVGIISTKSSMQQPWPIGCQGAGGPYYCEQSGTSMAAPHIAGIVALLREFFQVRLNIPNPSAALIKAVLLNGGQQVNGFAVPNMRDGFGRVNMSDSLPSAGFLSYVDERTGITTAQKKTYTYVVGTNYPFSLTLAWTDKAPTVYSNQSQKKLINDLDLVVTDPQGNQYYGNDITSPYNNQPDSLNNVEQVRIAAPIKGKYTVEVKGANVPQGPQDFAFALTYDNALITVIPKGYIVAPCMIGGQPC